MSQFYSAINPGNDQHVWKQQVLVRAGDPQARRRPSEGKKEQGGDGGRGQRSPAQKPSRPDALRHLLPSS